MIFVKFLEKELMRFWFCAGHPTAKQRKSGCLGCASLKESNDVLN